MRVGLLIALAFAVPFGAGIFVFGKKTEPTPATTEEAPVVEEVAPKPVAPPTTTPSAPKNAAPPPWRRPAQKPPDGFVDRQEFWSAWFPGEPFWITTIQQNPSYSITYIYSRYRSVKETEFRVSNHFYSDQLKTDGDYLQALKKYKHGMVDVWEYKDEAGPVVPKIVDGLPTIEFRSTGKSFGKPQSYWVRAAFIGTDIYAAKVKGPDPKAVFGKDAERFIRSLQFTPQAKAAHKKKP